MQIFLKASGNNSKAIFKAAGQADAHAVLSAGDRIVDGRDIGFHQALDTEPAHAPVDVELEMDGQE